MIAGSKLQVKPSSAQQACVRHAIRPNSTTCRATVEATAAVISRSYIWDHIIPLPMSHDSWNGYAGYWHMGGPSGPAVDAGPTRNVRMWKYGGPAGDTSTVTQRNVYEHASPMLASSPRAHDGYFDATFTWSSEIPAHEPTAADIDGVPGWAERRMATIGRDALAMVRPQVPLTPLAPTDYPPPKEVLERPGMWTYELFVVDGNCRWSTVGIYDTATGARLRAGLIQEYQVAVQDADARMDMGTMPLLPPRPRLPEDPAQWLQAAGSASKAGSPEDVHVESRCMMVNPKTLAFEFAPTAAGPRKATWPLPDLAEQLADGSADLVLLPDSMYAVLPKALPAFSDRKAFRLEFGGVMRSSGDAAPLLRRMVVEYDGATGRMTSVTLDNITAC